MRMTIAIISALAALTAPAAAMADFAGPAGWSASAVPVSADSARTFKQWHLGDVATVTYIKDTSLSYAAALDTIEKNFSTNNIKPTTDKDQPCQGKGGHVVEFATGPDGHRIIINRILVPDGNGVQTVTYTRPEGVAFDNDVKKVETDFCGASG